jgi:hypothetical protein
LADLIERLKDMAKDLHAGMLNVATSADENLQRLHALLQTAPMPTVRHRFDVFMEESEDRAAHAVASELTPDAELTKLEKKWKGVFHQAKPSLTTLQNGAQEVWDNAPEWLDLLQKHPQRG